MLICEWNEFPNIDASFFANHRQFIGKCDLHIAAGIFHKFAHFRSSAISLVELSGHKFTIEFSCRISRGVINATDYTIIVHKFKNHIAWEYSLWAIGDMNASFQFGTLSKNEFCHFFSSAYWRGRFDNEQITFFQKWNHSLSSRFHITDVGFVLRLKRSRHNDEIHIAFKRRGACHEALAVHSLFEQGLKTRLDDV